VTTLREIQTVKPSSDYPRAYYVQKESNFSRATFKVTTLAFVQPAWLGGWCWNKVAPQLRSQGHEVLAPT